MYYESANIEIIRNTRESIKRSYKGIRPYSNSVNHSSKLKLVIGQRNSLKSFMKTTHNKKQYRRLLAILQKVKGRTYE
ncbi:MAG: hypothetical protein WAM14_16160, partial [Candidatus Nitrosopolaris sp.]